MEKVSMLYIDDPMLSARISGCLADISAWMKEHHLQLGLWRYWIFHYRGEAATNIAVWRLIARPPPPPSKKINWRGRTCASAWSAAPKRLRAAEPQHIVAGVRFHWSREEMQF